MTFADRAHAGRQLAAGLQAMVSEAPITLGLPRGGVMVTAEIAKALKSPTSR